MKLLPSYRGPGADATGEAGRFFAAGLIFQVPVENTAFLPGCLSAGEK
jgi:hypothetical protein